MKDSYLNLHFCMFSGTSPLWHGGGLFQQAWAQTKGAGRLKGINSFWLSLLKLH